MSHRNRSRARDNPEKNPSYRLNGPCRIVKFRVFSIAVVDDVLANAEVGNQLDTHSQTVHNDHNAEKLWGQKSRQNNARRQANHLK